MQFQKKEKPTNLRCYKCGNEFRRDLPSKDNFSDLECPRCKKATIEIDLGKK